MFTTTYNILGATEEAKRDFISTFSAQIMEVNKKLGKLFVTGDIEFGTAFIILICLALSHAYNNTALLYQQLKEIINPLHSHVATNYPFPSISLSPFSQFLI